MVTFNKHFIIKLSNKKFAVGNTINFNTLLFDIGLIFYHSVFYWKVKNNKKRILFSFFVKIIVSITIKWMIIIFTEYLKRHKAKKENKRHFKYSKM